MWSSWSTTRAWRRRWRRPPRGEPAGPPARRSQDFLALTLLHLEQAERSALRIRENREASPWEVLRRQHLLPTRVNRLLECFVDVVDREVDHPVGRHLLRNHRVHLHPARDPLAAQVELGVGRLVLAHSDVVPRPTEDLLIERLGLVDATGVELGPRVRVRLAHDLGAVHLRGLPDRYECSSRTLEHRHPAVLEPV